MEKVVNSKGIKLTTAVSDTFKVVATPSQELQLELSNLAAKGNDAVNVAHKKPTNVEVKKDNERNDMALNVLQQMSEQERIHQEYRKQAQQINIAIDMALADANTPEERQEILDYQSNLSIMENDIEEKRSLGIDVTTDEADYLEFAVNSMPENVRTKYNNNHSIESSISEPNLNELDSLTGTSFASTADNNPFDTLPDMNKSFQSAISDTQTNEQITTEPNNTPITPSDFSKFTN